MTGSIECNTLQNERGEEFVVSNASTASFCAKRGQSTLEGGMIGWRLGALTAGETAPPGARKRENPDHLAQDSDGAC
jgi:hypothetical protein